MGGCENSMKDFKMSAKALVMIQGSSKGTQPKYYEDGYWYKQNNKGYEGTSEYLVSLVLSCSNVDNYVTYEKCLINGNSGCRSRSFLGPKESFISFERLHEMLFNIHLEDAIRQFETCKERLAYVKNFLLDEFSVDCSEYLSQILSLDALTLNCDRHFNNLGVVIDNETGICIPAPIFDNGDALLSNYEKFDGESLEENIEKVYARPFSASHIRQAVDAGIGIELDYEKLYSLLEQEPDSRAREVLYYQLEVMRNLIPEIS